MACHSLPSSPRVVPPPALVSSACSSTAPFNSRLLLSVPLACCPSGLSRSWTTQQPRQTGCQTRLRPSSPAARKSSVRLQNSRSSSVPANGEALKPVDVLYATTWKAVHNPLPPLTPPSTPRAIFHFTLTRVQPGREQRGRRVQRRLVGGQRARSWISVRTAGSSG